MGTRPPCRHRAREDRTTATLDRAPDDPVVTAQRDRHRLGRLLPQAGGALDVGEEERHHPGRERRRHVGAHVAPRRLAPATTMPTPSDPGTLLAPLASPVCGGRGCRAPLPPPTAAQARPGGGEPPRRGRRRTAVDRGTDATRRVLDGRGRRRGGDGGGVRSRRRAGDGRRRWGRLLEPARGHGRGGRAAADGVAHDPRPCVDPAPTNEAERVRAELEGRMSAGDRRFLQLSDADGVVHVGLRADGEALAAELTERHGDVVAVTVGRFGFPGFVTQPGTGVCTDPVGDPIDAAIRTELVVDVAPEQPGAWGSGSIRLHNDGPDSIRFTSGTATGTLVRDGRAIGTYEGALRRRDPGRPPARRRRHDPLRVRVRQLRPRARRRGRARHLRVLVVAVPGRPGLLAGPVPVEIPARPTTTTPSEPPTAEALTPTQEAAALRRRRRATHPARPQLRRRRAAPVPRHPADRPHRQPRRNPRHRLARPRRTVRSRRARSDRRPAHRHPPRRHDHERRCRVRSRTPPTDGPAPLRPEAVVGLGPIRHDGDEYRIGGYLQFGPGGFSWAEYALSLDGDHATITRTVSRAVT